MPSRYISLRAFRCSGVRLITLPATTASRPRPVALRQTRERC
jgi:hypothetical protein